MGKGLCLCLFLLSTIHSIVFSQNQINNSNWTTIERAIKEKHNLDSVSQKLIQLKNEAKASNKDVEYLRAIYYLIAIDDQRKEDTFYFRNSAFIDTLLLREPSPKAELVLHLLQAMRLEIFQKKSLRFNRAKYELKDIPVNYATFNRNQLDSIIAFHYESARKIVKRFSGESVDEYLWLASDPFRYLYKPVLYDLVLGEGISYFDDKERFSIYPEGKQILVFSQDEMIERVQQLSKESNLKTFKWYDDWTSFNRNRPEAYYYIESLLRKWMAASYSGTQADSLYAIYLERISSSPVNTVRAHGVYQLCLWWNKESMKYSPDPNYDFRYERPFQTQYQYLAAKALNLFEKNQQVLDSFAYLKSILVRMKNQILEPMMRMEMQAEHLPGASILTSLNYKNTPVLYYRIIRGKYYDLIDETKIISELLKRAVYREERVDLKIPADHNYHRTHIKIADLARGKYYLLFSDKPFTEKSSIINYVQFSVSGIAMLNSDKRVYVLDRKTGFPITNAKVIGSYTGEVVTKDNKRERRTIEKSYQTNKEGFIELTDSRFNKVEVFYNTDSLLGSINQHEDYYDNDEVYDKEEYDDLIEYYTEYATMHIFTDRSIYRPGQTVYYKALFLTKNSKTGDWMVMNKENMKGGIFKNWYKRWLKEDEPEIFIRDPFGKTADSIKIRPNEYGSQSGSFKIPMTAATGEWDFDTDYYDLGENEGIFRVEEYKRPSYEITIENPGKKLLYPADSITYKVKLRSFAGAALNNVRVEYELTSDGRYMEYDSIQKRRVWSYHDKSIIKHVGYTNNNGILEINVVDSLAKNLHDDPDERNEFRYTLEAKAIDETGETYTVEDNFIVSSRPVRINIPFAKVYDREKPASIKVQALDAANNALRRTVQVKIWKKQKTQKSKTAPRVDQWIYPVEELEATFPDISFRENNDSENLLVFDKTLQVENELKLDLPFDKLSAGEYEVKGASIEEGKITGEKTISFSVYDSKMKELPDSSEGFFHVPFNSVKPGDTIQFLHGNSSGDYYTITEIKFYSKGKKITAKSIYYHDINRKGINHWAKTISSNAIDQILLSQVYILNNKLYSEDERIYVNGAATSNPEIIVEQYRKKLVPGSKETFIVSIKTRNENKAMELLTTMYDASLDKLEEHKWATVQNDRQRYIYASWPSSIGRRTMSYDWQIDRPLPYGAMNGSLWWLNPVDYSYNFGATNGNFRDGMLMGRASGIDITNTDGLQEVVVTALGTSTKRSLTGSLAMVTIRGMSSLNLDSQLLIIIDGVPYTGDLSKLDPNAIKGAMVLKGADATSLYGSRASNGVLLLSTTGEVVIPELKEESPQPKIRKNFSETAFFFPEVHADKDGFYKFSFTMPESVTEWNWKLFAHSKQAEFVYADRKLNTQLPMMVQPHMPRLLYMGDKVVLQSRISNLDTNDIAGKINIKIEDVATGADLTNSFSSTKEKEFKLGKKSNTAVGFELKIPAKQLNPLKIVISASSANFADAEEHILPILNPKIFVRSSKDFYLVNKDTTIQSPTLPDDAEVYGIGLSINPKPQRALINALPYLANYPYGCAEQLFNKLYANIVAAEIMRTDPMAQQSFEKAKNTKQDSTAQLLPDQLADQTMPWLGLSNKTIQQQKQLMELFDPSKSKTQIKQLLDKIYKLQNSDGGMAWFDGGKSNPYISSYLLAGFGRIREKQSLILNVDDRYKRFINSLQNYCYSMFVSTEDKMLVNFYYLNNIYAMGFWKDEISMVDSIRNGIGKWLDAQYGLVHKKTLGDQALIIVASLKYAEKNSALYKKATAQLNSIRQLANNDDANGMRWKDIADADDMISSAEETVALLSEAFDEAGMGRNVNPGIVKWLLRTRNEDHWSTTKGTAAAIERIQKETNTIIGPEQTLVSKSLNDMQVTDDNLRGKPFAFYSTEEKNKPVGIQRSGNAPAAGSVSWYYFSTQVPGNSTAKIQLDKKLFYLENGRWIEMTASTIFKVGDKVKVELTINADKALRFVFIDDKRAAGFEPEKIESGYQYSGGISYYQSVRDAGMQIFAEFIPSGRSTINYEWVVSQEGEFLNGPASLQCMYKPEANAYSNGMTVRSVK